MQNPAGCSEMIETSCKRGLGRRFAPPGQSNFRGEIQAEAGGASLNKNPNPVILPASLTRPLFR